MRFSPCCWSPPAASPNKPLFSNTDLKADQLHPNVTGHALLSSKIFDALKAIGYAR